MSCHRLFAATAVAALFSGAALAGSFSSIVVYGDSLSDNGNLFAATGFPGPPYYMGRRSNGPVAVEQVASSLGVPLVDFAWIGATTGIGNFGDGGTPTSFGTFNLPGMLTELSKTQNAIAPYTAGGLFIVWGGPNDFLSPSRQDTTPQQIIGRAVTDLVTIVGTLESKGAKNILVPGMPDLGLTPYFRSLGPTAAAGASAATDAFNSALEASLPSGVKYVDTASLLRAIVSQPAAYGFTDVTDACFTGTSLCSDANKYLFFDSFHPTSHADALLAEEFIAAAVPEPRTTFLFAVGLFSAGYLLRLKRTRTSV